VSEPAGRTNARGLALPDYKGLPSTLCKGCGHDVVSNAIVQACFEMGVEPHAMVKMSGIGCSSKTPAYFLSSSWGFNSVHGRMPSVATGALLANRSLRGIGVSGDGDTASIGIGQFVHLVRRNLPFLYVVENNGVYGLTKGQFSATADVGSRLKDGTTNPFPPIDLCATALGLGATFVARGFSADRKQLVELLKSGLAHRGLALLDVLSPCVTFNDHEGSTRSYDWGRDHQGRIHELGFVPAWESPEVSAEGDAPIEVPMPDGGRIVVRRVGAGHDPRDRVAALRLLHEGTGGGEYLTGLFYVATDRPTLPDTLGLVDDPLATLPEARVRPSPAALEAINQSLR
jgi:2-oxoglutarate ferredoxin oxidoreductase subunit beta